MLNTKKMIELKKAVNLKAICEAGGLSYYAIFQRLQHNWELRDFEAEKISEGLRKYGLTYNTPSAKNSSNSQ